MLPPPSFRGGMIFTFYKARGLKTGKSMVEEDKLDLAKRLEAMAKAKGVELLLPVDVIVADKFDANANDKVGGGTGGRARKSQLEAYPSPAVGRFPFSVRPCDLTPHCFYRLLTSTPSRTSGWVLISAPSRWRSSTRPWRVPRPSSGTAPWECSSSPSSPRALW